MRNVLWKKKRKKTGSGFFLLKYALVVGYMATCLCGALTGVADADILVNGGFIAGSISSDGEIDRHTFTAEAGDHIEIQVSETEPTAGASPLIELYGPDGGDALLSNYGGTVAQVAVTIEEEGEYTLLVQDRTGAYTFDYNAYYVNIPGADEHGELINGDVRTETITLGDLDTYTFTVEAGDHIEIQVSETEPTAGASPLIELYGPDGGDALLSNYGGTVAQVAVTIEEEGEYTLLVQDRTGAYTFDYNAYFVTDGDGLTSCGDLDHDNDVDQEDGNILRQAFRTTTGDDGFIEEADYDMDGDIDYSDYQLWYQCYNDFVAAQ